MAIDPNFIEERKADLCASLQCAIIDILLNKLIKAAKECNMDIAIAGGVSVTRVCVKLSSVRGLSVGGEHSYHRSNLPPTMPQ